MDDEIRDYCWRKAAMELYESDRIVFDEWDGHVCDFSPEGAGTREDGGWVEAWVFVPRAKAQAIQNNIDEEDD